MKKLSALALCAVMAPVYALGMGSVFAADQEKSSATQQVPGDSSNRGAVDSMNEQQDSGMYDVTSAPTVDTRDGSGMSDMSENETRDSGRTEQPVVSGDAAEAFYADDLIGKNVINRNGDANIGSISDLVFSEDGRILSVIVGVGGFLGMGAKDVAIPWSEVKRELDADGDSYVITVDRDEQSLKDAVAHERPSVRSASVN